MGADGIDEFGLEATEVRAESTGRDIAIGVGGILVVIAAAIPLTWGVLTVGTAAYALVSGMLAGATGTGV
ncbi:hypothetical protein PX701_09460 [Agromyces sp. H3Y2-19a]|uniref:hypothetical protein n=1 Tax=Agromyces TaxID=33877 RepID=UPI001E370323|nr:MULTISPECIES: hypothetical protein [Agromyces]MCD5344975.1 hypothetical protein [Agromyces sp. S2-1-8]MDF0513846.1 hypothetical protein [Agromyces chromiiresistens]